MLVLTFDGTPLRGPASGMLECGVKSTMKGMTTGDPSAAPTLGELFARRGWVLNLEVFDDIIVDVSGPEARRCDYSACTHGEGRIPLRRFVDMVLSRSSLTFNCFFLAGSQRSASPEIIAFNHLCVKAFRLYTNPDWVLDNASFEWAESLNEILLPHTSGLSHEEANRAWLRSSIRARKDELLNAFLDKMVHAGPPPDAEEDLTGGDLVLVGDSPVNGPFEAQALLEECFGYSGMPGVVIVPENLVRVVSKETTPDSPIWGIFAGKNWESHGGVLHFLGLRGVCKPVKMIPAYTATVRETAGTLREHLSLREALTAALEV